MKSVEVETFSGKVYEYWRGDNLFLFQGLFLTGPREDQLRSLLIILSLLTLSLVHLVSIVPYYPVEF